MALKWIDGFETFATADLLNRKYASGEVGYSKIEIGRTGVGKSLAFVGPVVPPQDTEFATPDLTNQGTWVVGFAFSHKMPNGEFVLLELRDSAVPHIQLKFNPQTQIFRVFNNGVVIGAGTKPLNPGPWYYIELKTVIGLVAGSVELRINEVTDILVNNVRTQNTGNATANRVAWRKPAGYFTQYNLDDIYILDSTGTRNNNFLGDMKVELIEPSGPGTTTQWTPNPSNVPNWQAALADDTSFVQTSVPGAVDTYQYGDLQNIAGNVAGVAVSVYARNTDATAHALKSVVRQGSTNYEYPTTQIVNDISFHYKSFLYETDPSTAVPWTMGGVNSAEFGVKLVGITGFSTLGTQVTVAATARLFKRPVGTKLQGNTTVVANATVV
jgi:hypothetical protein